MFYCDSRLDNQRKKKSVLVKAQLVLADLPLQITVPDESFHSNSASVLDKETLLKRLIYKLFS